MLGGSCSPCCGECTTLEGVNQTLISRVATASLSVVIDSQVDYGITLAHGGNNGPVWYSPGFSNGFRERTPAVANLLFLNSGARAEKYWIGSPGKRTGEFNLVLSEMLPLSGLTSARTGGFCRFIYDTPEISIRAEVSLLPPAYSSASYFSFPGSGCKAYMTLFVESYPLGAVDTEPTSSNIPSLIQDIGPMVFSSTQQGTPAFAYNAVALDFAADYTAINFDTAAPGEQKFGAVNVWVGEPPSGLNWVRASGSGVLRGALDAQYYQGNIFSVSGNAVTLQPQPSTVYSEKMSFRQQAGGSYVVGSAPWTIVPDGNWNPNPGGTHPSRTDGQRYYIGVDTGFIAAPQPVLTAVFN